MKRYLIAVTILGAMASVAMAQTTKPHAQRQLLKSLDLTPAQKQQAKTILQSTRQQAQPLAQQLRQGRQSLTAAIHAGDSAQIQQLSTAMGTLHGQVLAVRSAGRAQVYALLTPDQKAKAAALEPKRE